ncbi:MAG: dienelactone hydrolase family protein [Gemmobacter sp.]|nr:dienelactone hydrolase family protein [Gemmobacter sp.]
MGKLVSKNVSYQDGGTKCTGYFAYDDSFTAGGRKLAGVLVAPEWWGLNDYARGRANRLAGLGYAAFALDIYGDGKNTTDPKEAGALAGAFYAMANIATREWCAGESAETLLGGFFAAVGIFGAIGLVVLTLWPQPVPEGVAGFVLRGPVWPSGAFLFWTFVQAAGSLLGVGLVIRAYQLAEASRVAVFEYVILPASAFWGWVIWQEHLSLTAALGMVLIATAGVMIAMRARGGR